MAAEVDHERRLSVLRQWRRCLVHFSTSIVHQHLQ